MFESARRRALKLLSRLTMHAKVSVVGAVHAVWNGGVSHSSHHRIHEEEDFRIDSEVLAMKLIHFVAP